MPRTENSAAGGFRRSYPHGSQTVHQNNFQRPTPIPLSVTSVRCFLSSRSPGTKAAYWVRGSGVLSRTEAAAFTQTIFNALPNSPLCDLCGLCAMLSPLRVAPPRKSRTGSAVAGVQSFFPAWKPPVSTKQYFPKDFLFNGSLGRSASRPRTLPVHYPRRPQSLPGFSPWS
jgi:hypothetical protein